MIVSFIVAYIVNIVYPKETNLVVGLCVGAVVGYSQWLVLKKQRKISSFWGMACAIGMGLPFIVVVVLHEVGIQLPDRELLSRIGIGIIGGLLSGLLQVRLLRTYYARAAWWILASSAGWGLCWLATTIGVPLIGLIVGGIILGLVTGFCLLWIQKFPLQREQDTSDPTNR